jgi:16S rRNA processing protein RimM
MVDGDALVPIAVVARPHGVRGEVRVSRLNPESTLLYEVDAVILRREGEERRCVVEGARQGPKGAVLMRLAGVGDRDAAEALRGTELLVPRSALPPTEEDEWYFVDLIGLEAVDGEGAALGRVVDVLEYPTIDCLAVHDGREVREVPMSEPYLVDVRLEEGRVILSAIDDLPARKPTKRERGR